MEWDAHILVFDVVEVGAFEFEPLGGSGTAFAPDRVLHGLAEGAAGMRGRVVEDFLKCAGGDDFAPTAAGAWSEVEDPVGTAHSLLVMLHDDEGVSFFGQGLEGVKEAFVVAGVESDGRLVQNIKHAAQVRAELCSKANALGFSAGEGFGTAVEREVVESDLGKEFQALADFCDHIASNLRSGALEIE